MITPSVHYFFYMYSSLYIYMSLYTLSTTFMRIIDLDRIVGKFIIQLSLIINKIVCLNIAGHLKCKKDPVILRQDDKVNDLSITGSHLSIALRSEEHTSDSSHVSISYAVF